MAYRYVPRFEWVEWEPPTDEQIEEMEQELVRFDGFKVKVLMNPSNGDVRTESKAHEALRKGSMTIEEYYKVIAPRIVDWNFEMEDESGEWTKVPAPGEHPDNWQALMLPDFLLVGWILATARYAYLPKSKVPTSKSAGSSDTEAPTTDQI